MNALQQFVSFARRQPIVVVSVTVLLLLGLVDYFYLYQRQGELIMHHDRVRQEGEKTMLALTSHNRAIAQLASLQETLARIDKNLVAEGDLAENLGYFYQLENASHGRLSDLHQLAAQGTEEGNPFKTVPFAFRVNGSYYQVMNFMHELEIGPRIPKIRSYSFSRRDPTGDSMALDLVIELLARQ